MTNSLEGISLEEAWTGRKQTIQHLRAFGSIAYRHIPQEKRRKFYDKSKKCILVGYDDSSKAYQLYDTKTNKLHISRDVKFKEECHLPALRHDDLLKDRL